VKSYVLIAPWGGNFSHTLVFTFKYTL